MKLRVCLDTSVFSAYLDDRTPERQQQTVEFWERLPEFEVVTSEVAREEMMATKDADVRDRLLGLLDVALVLPLPEAAHGLVGRYIAQGAFPQEMRTDAYHVAVAVLAGCSVVVSWNLRHLANARRCQAVNEVNGGSGLPTVDIVAPPAV